MSQTARLNLTKPDENQDPFFSIVDSLFNQLDTFIHANLVDRNMFLRGGGTLSFIAGSDQLTIGSNLLIRDLTSGFSITILAGTFTLADGAALYIDTQMHLSQNITVTPAVGQKTGVGSGRLVLAFRQGTRVIFRDGTILDSGASGNLIEVGPAADVRRGTATFAAVAFMDVTFVQPYPDTSYQIVGLVGDMDAAFYALAASKVAGGFRINVVGGGSVTGDVTWKTERVV